MCTQVLIFPVPGYTETVIIQTTVVFRESQGVRLKESSSSSTQYGSKMLHLFLGTNPESQHIINHSVFIYLHLWVPSESMGGAFLIRPIRILYSPKRSLGQLWDDEGMFLVFQGKRSCFLTALVASGDVPHLCCRGMSWNLSHHEAQHWDILGYCQARKWPQKLKQQKNPRGFWCTLTARRFTAQKLPHS